MLQEALDHLRSIAFRKARSSKVSELEIKKRSSSPLDDAEGLTEIVQNFLERYSVLPRCYNSHLRVLPDFRCNISSECAWVQADGQRVGAMGATINWAVHRRIPDVADVDRRGDSYIRSGSAIERGPRRPRAVSVCLQLRRRVLPDSTEWGPRQRARNHLLPDQLLKSLNSVLTYKC
eukprot:IDg9662t1